MSSLDQHRSRLPSFRRRHSHATTFIKFRLRPGIGWRGWSSWLRPERMQPGAPRLAEDKHLLDDLGLTREQALDEAARPFWR